MVISTLGFAFISYEESKQNNQNPDSGKDTGAAFVDARGQKIYLTSSLNSIKNVSVKTSFSINNYAEKRVYIDSESDNIYYELASIIGRYAAKVQKGCFGSCEKNLPEKNCTDFMIVWNKKDENRAYQEDNCVFIEGDIRAVDAFIYKLFEI